MTFTVGEELELRIERLVAGGDGVGRYEGQVVFVPRTAPGDLVRVIVTRVSRRWARGRVQAVVEPGKGRRESPCSWSEACGGCTWMHLDDRTQHDAREAILRDALARIGGVRNPPPIQRLSSPVSLEYRARARVAVAGGCVGFREAGSHRVVDIPHCRVLDPETQRELVRVRASPPRGPTEVEIRGFGDRVEVGGRTLRIGRESFFQANRHLWASWQSAVAEACGRGGSLVELYCGTGLYTVALTERFDRVCAVESGGAAADARRNSTARVVNARAEAWAPAQLPGLKPQVVLVNPPRAGCHTRVIDAIRSAAPGRVVYVSCDPTTLARDVGRLSPDYCVKRLLLIDALPQTHHVEVLCVLEPGKST